MQFPIVYEALMLSEPRRFLERLCAERGEDFAGLSRMLGRNPAYIQQFVRRGVPKRLGEEERRKLARYFSVSEALLGGPPEPESPASGLVSVKRHPVSVSAGPGAVVSEELGKPYFAFEERWLKALTASGPAKLSIVRVEGDSMAPTLNAGDDILVDLGDCAERLRDGIYVLRIDDAVVVKRLALNPMGRRVTVQSDNPAYSDWPDCGLGDINCIGRVIWSGRRIV
jgi:phage repressor protein C with HTH and peptisase S24 domain